MHRRATHDWSRMATTTAALFITRVDRRHDQQLSVGILWNVHLRWTPQLILIVYSRHTISDWNVALLDIVSTAPRVCRICVLLINVLLTYHTLALFINFWLTWLHMTLNSFYRAMRMHKRGICCHPVSVRLSVTFVSCAKTNEDIFEMFYHRVATPF